MPRPRFAKLEPAKRDRILDAAAVEFGELGFERSSYNRIIDRAGLSKGAMYYYFDDKEDLFRTVVGGVVDLLACELSVIEATSEADYWARLEHSIAAVLELGRTNARVATTLPLLVESWRRTDLASEPDACDRRIHAAIERWVALGVEQGAIRGDFDAATASTLALAMMEAVLVLAQKRGAPPCPSFLVDLMQRAAGPKASTEGRERETAAATEPRNSTASGHPAH